jgi:predicted dehydrogenase
MKVLIIGLGSIAKKHILSILSNNPNSIIYAYRSSKSLTTVENVLNITCLDKFNQSIDFIIISNPTAFHGSTILNVIKFKVPIFIEKPVLDNLNLFEPILQEIKSNKIVTYIGCNLRFHPVIQYLKTYISDHNPRINELNIYSGSDLKYWRPYDDYKKSYSANSNLGGGVHLDLIHEIDYCLWIFGLPNKVHSVMSKKSSLNIDAIDNARYIFEYQEFTASINLNYFRKDTKRQIEIVTDTDTLLLDLEKCTIYKYSTNSIIFMKDFKIQDTYDEQLLYFINCINNNIVPMNSFEDGILTLKIALNNAFN